MEIVLWHYLFLHQTPIVHTSKLHAALKRGRIEVS